MSASLETLSRFWCRATHRQPMWPVNGMYRCSQCLRTYRVPWDIPQLNEKAVVVETAPVVPRQNLMMKWVNRPATR